MGSLDTIGGNVDLAAGVQIDVGSIDTSDAGGSVMIEGPGPIAIGGSIDAGGDVTITTVAAGAVNLDPGVNIESAGGVDISDAPEIVTGGTGTSTTIDGVGNVSVAPIRSGDAALSSLAIIKGVNLNVSSIDLSNSAAGLSLESTGGNITVAADRIAGSGVEFDPTNEPNALILKASTRAKSA